MGISAQVRWWALARLRLRRWSKSTAIRGASSQCAHDNRTSQVNMCNQYRLERSIWCSLVIYGLSQSERTASIAGNPLRSPPTGRIYTKDEYSARRCSKVNGRGLEYSEGFCCSAAAVSGWLTIR